MSSSVTIIGGADGPTSIFLASDGSVMGTVKTVLGIALLVILPILYIRKHKK